MKIVSWNVAGIRARIKNNQLQKFIDENDFDILSVQRNLKILGIFVRLYKRDRKPNYLKYLPYTWALIEKRMKNQSFYNSLKHQIHI